MIDKKLFAKNAFSGVFQKLIIAVLTFFTIPIFISKLGAISYGIFATVSVIGDLSRIANIGFHIALIKYLSIQGKTKESSIDILVALTSMILIIVPVSVLMIVFNHFVLVKILNISLADLDHCRTLYIFLVLANMLLFIGLTFSAMLESQKQIYKSNLSQLIYSISYWSLILMALWFGKGLDTIGMMAFFAALIWFGLIVFMAFKAWGKLSVRGFSKLYWKSVKKQLTYGLQIYASGLMGLFGEPLVKVLVANFFGHAYVGFLEIGIRIRNQVQRIFEAALWPLFQLFSEIRDDESKSRIIKEIQEKATLIILPICFLIIFGANSLVTLWIGNNVSMISMSIIAVTVSSLIGFLIFNAMNHYLGVDRPMLLLVSATISNVLYLGVILLLHNILGFNSVLLSFVISYFVNALLMLFLQKYFLQSMIFDSRKQFFNLFFYIIIVALMGWLITMLIHSPLLVLGILAIVVPGASLILFVMLGLINQNDIARYIKNKTIAAPFYRLINIKESIWSDKKLLANE